MNAQTPYMLATTEARTRYLSNNQGRLWLSTNVQMAIPFKTRETAEEFRGSASDMVGKELTARVLGNYGFNGVRV